MRSATKVWETLVLNKGKMMPNDQLESFIYGSTDLNLKH